MTVLWFWVLRVQILDNNTDWILHYATAPADLRRFRDFCMQKSLLMSMLPGARDSSSESSFQAFGLRDVKSVREESPV